jgi:predicted transcriptional regulator
MRSVTPAGADNFLPGFEALIATRDVIAQMTDEQIDLHFPERTGENLRSTNPQLYSVAAQLFYEFGFSQREIAVICKISRATVAAIVEREMSATATRQQQTARLNRIKALRERTLANLEGLMADAEAVKKAGPVAIANIFKILGEEEAALADKLNAEVVVEPEPKASNLDDIKYLQES